MDSYSVRTVGEHCCGAQGFNPWLGDKCPACEQRRIDVEEIRKLAELRKTSAGRGTEARWRELTGRGEDD